MLKKMAFTVLALACLSVPAFAENKEAALPVPRFVTLGTDEVNLRTGPGLRYPIRLIVRRDGLPVEVVREFDVWRQVRDMDGDEGWVHKSMLSGRRAVVIKGQMRDLMKNAEEGKPIARLEPGVVAALKACNKDWCEVEAAGFEGWLHRDEIWGVYPDERLGE